MNTKAIGDASVAAILAVLVKEGRRVLIPWGDNLRYDLGLDLNGELVRIQCKTGRLYEGSVSFPTCSSYAHRGGTKKDYRGDADYFGVYCPELDQVFFVPVGIVGRHQASLRIEATKNGQQEGLRLAADYRKIP